MATRSSILVWETPWIEEPGRQQSIGSYRVGHDTCARAHTHTHTHTHTRIKTVEMCSLAILRTEISTQNVGRAALPLGALEKNFSFASSSSGRILAFYDL